MFLFWGPSRNANGAPNRPSRPKVTVFFPPYIHSIREVHPFIHRISGAEQGIVLLSKSTMATAPFLKVPAEIRLNIYKLLLSDHMDMTLCICTEELSIYEQRKRNMRRRSKFRYIADRMRSRSAESTYCLEALET